LTTDEILQIGSEALKGLRGTIFEVFTLSEPPNSDAAPLLAKIISKLSPLVGNLIEFNTVEFLNDSERFSGLGEWERQDPGFPDTIFVGDVQPVPGFEIKAWFPLSTEITARFKDSQNHFASDQTYVAMLAWLPEHILFGRPKIIDIVVVSGMSVAKTRDDHYHNPPDYLVIEPEDTSQRTSNLQQTNTNGYKFQGDQSEMSVAESVVDGWGPDGRAYVPTREYQEKLRGLLERFRYRLDTNYAKMDRIAHHQIEEFKTRTLNTEVSGLTIAEWARVFSRGTPAEIKAAVETYLGVRRD
jgi:hypothetical protein